MVECGEYRIAWDRGTLAKKRIDPIKHASLYYGTAFPWRILCIGEQGTAEYRQGDELDSPTAVYPTWEYGDDAILLEEIVANPVGEDEEICKPTKGVKSDEIPVFGQEHRVVIIGSPPGNTGPGRAFFRYIKELQEDHPDCIIHVHGLYGWKIAFGMGFGAADIDPRAAAQKGKIHLPSGKEEVYEYVQLYPQWVTVLGFKPKDLEVPRNRCMYNIKSAVWAGENYAKLFKFKTRGSIEVDTTSSTVEFKPVETKSPSTKGTMAKKSEGDRFLCDTCSLSNDCKYYRSGSVCTVPGAEPTELARYFNSRDADLIIDGLGTVLAAGARRLERGYKTEQVFGEVDAHVTKMQAQVFDQGVKLAKLLNPALTGGAKVQVNVGGGSAVQVNTNPREAVAAAIRELEARGVKRSDITPAMIQGLFEGMHKPDERRQVIEAKVIEAKEEST
jgi:hypothetical protein